MLVFKRQQIITGKKQFLQTRVWRLTKALYTTIKQITPYIYIRDSRNIGEVNTAMRMRIINNAYAFKVHTPWVNF